MFIQNRKQSEKNEKGIGNNQYLSVNHQTENNIVNRYSTGCENNSNQVVHSEME